MLDHALKLTIFTALVFASTKGYKKAHEKPNIVFILADDLGYNDIGYHAKDHLSDIKTPFLDQLAEDGIKFENYYVQPVCSPTRSQLLTGRYPIHTGMQNGIIGLMEPRGLSLDNKLLPEYLGNCGYDTHMVGKWHLGFYKEKYLPWNRGFNSFYGFLSGGEDYFTRIMCSSRKNKPCGFDLWSANGSEPVPMPDDETEYSAHLFARKAIEAMDKRDSSKPFFLYLAYQSVHAPLQVPIKYTKQYAHIEDQDRRTYAGMVSALDESVKNVIEHLKEIGLMDNTIVVFSTDNGGSEGKGNNWPLRGAKQTLWEGGIRAVGFAHGKPLQINNVVREGLFDVSDWMPTLLKAASCSPKDLSLDGYDQWESLVNGDPSPRTELLHNIYQLHKAKPMSKDVKTPFDTTVRAAVRQGPWKLLTGEERRNKWYLPPEAASSFAGKIPSHQLPGDTHVKLFHIDTDPNETSNVASERPDIVEKLLARLAYYQSTAVHAEHPGMDPNADPQLRDGIWGPWMEDTE